MNSEQARSCFDASVDGTLTSEQRQAFAQALAADAVLRAEYERFRSMLAGARALGEDASAPVDLLAGVHQRIHERSGGRFFRDRFARSSSGARRAVLWLSVLMLGAAVAFTWTRCMVIEVGAPAAGQRAWSAEK